MRAAVFDQFGDPSVLRVEDVAQPANVEGSNVKVRDIASSVNPIDWKV